MKPSVPTSVGELYDKISILEIKAQRIEDAEKLAHVNKELSLLREIAAQFPADTELYEELKKVNETLWDIEDAIRIEETNQRFGDEFIKLARSVYATNDRRAEIKREINLASDSEIVEVKSYKQ